MGRRKISGSWRVLGALMTEDNEVSVEIQARIAAGNRCFCAYNKLLRSSSLSRRLKLTVYQVIILPVGGALWV